MSKSFTILAVFLSSLTVASAQATDTLCTSQETPVFSCRAGKKIASVCASKDLSPSSGYLQYRFGPQGAPEIQVPKIPLSSRQSISTGSLTFSGGGGAYLRFTEGEFGYVVYTASGRGWGEKTGVAVEKGEKLIANIKCSNTAQSELGPDWYEKAGLAEDRHGFDIP